MTDGNTHGTAPDPGTPEGARAYRFALDHMTDLVAVLDAEGRRVYNSPSYRAVFGDRALAGTDSFAEIHPEDRERVRRVFQETVATGAGQRTQYRFVQPGGAVRHIESQGDAVRDAAGNITHVVVVARDVTERVESEAKLQASNRELVATVQALERRHREDVVLGRLGHLLQMCQSIEEARAVLAQFVEELFPGGSGCLYLRNAGNDLLESVASWGGAALLSDPVIGRDDCWSLRRGQLHAVEDGGSRLVCPHLLGKPAGPSLCAPISAQGEALGMLYVQLGPEEAFLPRELRAQRFSTQQAWALTVSEHIALALSNLRLRLTLSAQALRDSLTGLYNRRYMEQALERELLRAARNGRPVGVVMLDLDHFKDFNDRHGHEAGDAMLRALGDYLIRHVRAEDIACRYGGEEFVVILPEAPAAMARVRAEELWKGLRALKVNHRGEMLAGCTASFGVAAYPADGAGAAEVLRAADAAMYAAKREGRDRVATGAAAG